MTVSSAVFRWLLEFVLLVELFSLVPRVFCARKTVGHGRVVFYS